MSSRVDTEQSTPAPLLWANRDNSLVASQRQVMLDFDSTVFPLLDAMAAHPDGGDHLGYEHIRAWGDLIHACGGGEAMLALFEQVMRHEAMRDHPPFVGAREAVAALRDHGVAVRVVSARHPKFAPEITAYLDDYGITVDEVLCAEPIDKVAWCHDNAVEILVDDHPKTLAAAHDAGLEALGLCFDFNRHFFVERGLPTPATWNELGLETLRAVERRVALRLACSEQA